MTKRYISTLHLKLEQIDHMHQAWNI